MNLEPSAMTPLRPAAHHVRRAVANLVLVPVVFAASCGVQQSHRSHGAVHPTYSDATGRLTELAFDSTGDGRVDTWVAMDGSRALGSRVDTDADGVVDRWEHYDTSGRLAKVGFSRANNGQADAWAFSGEDGTIQRIEISSHGDEHRIDRWEYYDAARLTAAGGGALVRAEEDTRGDGRPDKWETYDEGAIRTVAFDENGNGRPDRRLTHLASGRMVIESHPDGSGRFTRRVEVN